MTRDGGTCQFRLAAIDFVISPLHVGTNSRREENGSSAKKYRVQVRIDFSAGMPDLGEAIQCMKLAFIVRVAYPKWTVRHAMQKTCICQRCPAISHWAKLAKSKDDQR